jgi:hypothetical protein
MILSSEAKHRLFDPIAIELTHTAIQIKPGAAFLAVHPCPAGQKVGLMPMAQDL